MQETFLDPVTESEEEDFTKEEKFSCPFHPWAINKNNFILITIKKTGKQVLRCIYCERIKQENKQIRTSFWHKEKEEITDLYVKTVLRSGKNALKVDPPQPLIAAKRAVIQLKRVTDKLSQPLKKCAKHGKLYLEDVIKSGKSNNGEQVYKCKKCMKDLHDQHYKLNRTKILLKNKLYRTENKEKVSKIKRESWQKHRDKNLTKDKERRARFKAFNPEKYIEYNKRCSENLEDSYVKKKILRGTQLRSEDVPQSLIECTRALLLLKRNIKSQRKQNMINNLKEKIDDSTEN
jgi:hypothetical protein